MKKWAILTFLLLAGAATWTGCGSRDAAALPGQSSHITDRTASARQPIDKSGLDREHTLQTALLEDRVHAVVMRTLNAGWAYSLEHVWAISNAGAAWNLVWHRPIPILAFAAVSRTDAWAVTAPAGARRFRVWHTANGGHTWTSRAVPTRWQVVEAFMSVDARGDGRILVTGPVAPQTGPEALFAVDQGQVQAKPVYGSQAGGLSNIVFPARDAGVAVDQAVSGPQNISPPLFHTINGGVTWHPVVLPVLPIVASASMAKGGPEYIVNAPIDFVSASTGYAALESPAAKVYRTTNAGASWAPIHSPPVTAGYGISTTWQTPERGWVMAGTKGASILWGTFNGGKTWTRLASENFVSMPQFVSARDGWALVVVPHPNPYGGPNTFVRTVNGGRTWTPIAIR